MSPPPIPARATTSPPADRRRDLDRLRVLACLSTFCYHAIQIFDLNPYYHLKSVTLSPGIDVAARLLHAVRMPLFFLIAGLVGYLFAARYTDSEVLKRRAIRLLPPFLFGILLLTPWVKYFEVLDGRTISWRGIVPLEGPPPDMADVFRRYFTQGRWFSWSHMWFPLYLMIFAAVFLPVMRLLSRATWEPGRLSIALALVPLAALTAAELVLRPLFPFHIPNLFWDWASVAVYATCFLSGAVLARWNALEIELRAWLPAALLIALAGAVLHVTGETTRLVGIGRALWLFGFLATLLALAPLIGRGRIPGEGYLSEAALPLYVLHHVPLIVIGFYVKDLPWPIWQRWSVIVLGAFAVTLLAYHLLVRPFAGMRFMLGMAPPRAAR